MVVLPQRLCANLKKQVCRALSNTGYCLVIRNRPFTSLPAFPLAFFLVQESNVA